MNLMIQWCEICNNSPADGVLEVIRDGEVEVSYMNCCQWCVDHLGEDDWL